MEPPKEERETRSKEELIVNFRSVRDEVFHALHGLSPVQMTIPMDDSGLTVKDLLAHWIEWDLLEWERAGRYFAGKEIDYGPDQDNNAFNRKAFEKWKDKSPKELLFKFRETTAMIERGLEGWTWQQIFGDRGYRFAEEKDGRKIVRIVTPALLLVDEKHDHDHAKDIMEWKERTFANAS